MFSNIHQEILPASRVAKKAQDATVWRLQTLADASWNHLSQQLKDRHPQLPWREIYGFRNVAAHGYAHLNLERIWEIAHEHLGPLLQVVQQEIAESDQRSQ